MRRTKSSVAFLHRVLAKTPRGGCSALETSKARAGSRECIHLACCQLKGGSLVERRGRCSWNGDVRRHGLFFRASDQEDDK
jgi:hypothetical protein